MITAASSLKEVGLIVCSALHEIGVTAVLSGGSAATVWAPEAYQSRDLDFVAEFYGADKEVIEVLKELGYQKDGRVYSHASNSLTIDFPAAPLAVGSEILTTWSTIRDKDQLLHVITPTDSVKDRLAHFIHWGDRSGLQQALAVARAQEVSLDNVEAWCRAEGDSEAFAELKRLL